MAGPCRQRQFDDELVNVYRVTAEYFQTLVQGPVVL